MMKTHSCWELRENHFGQAVTLAGWVNRRRDQGGLIFIDLRDRWGITQITINQADAPEAHANADKVRNEFVIQVIGEVVERPGETKNDDLPTSSERKFSLFSISSDNNSLFLSIKSKILIILLIYLVSLIQHQEDNCLKTLYPIHQYICF